MAHCNQIPAGKFLYDNYKQALDIIAKTTPELDKFRHITGYTANDFEAWHKEERKYLRECKDEPETTTVAVEYVELLQKLQFAAYVFRRSCKMSVSQYDPLQSNIRKRKVSSIPYIHPGGV